MPIDSGQLETGVLIDANARAERLLGRRREEIIGLHQTKIHPASEAGHYRKLFQSSVECGEAVQEEIFVVPRDGNKIPAGVSASLFEAGSRRFSRAEPALDWPTSGAAWQGTAGGRGPRAGLAKERLSASACLLTPWSNCDLEAVASRIPNCWRCCRQLTTTRWSGCPMVHRIPTAWAA